MANAAAFGRYVLCPLCACKTATISYCASVLSACVEPNRISLSLEVAWLLASTTPTQYANESTGEMAHEFMDDDAVVNLNMSALKLNSET